MVPKASHIFIHMGVIIQKQALKIIQIMLRHGHKSNWLQIIKCLTPISQIISLSLNQPKIRPILPWDTTATTIKL